MDGFKEFIFNESRERFANLLSDTANKLSEFMNDFDQYTTMTRKVKRTLQLTDEIEGLQTKSHQRLDRNIAKTIMHCVTHLRKTANEDPGSLKDIVKQNFDIIREVLSKMKTPLNSLGVSSGPLEKDAGFDQLSDPSLAKQRPNTREKVPVNTPNVNSAPVTGQTPTSI